MQTKRWKRYGHDRLYFLSDDDEQLGWWDLRSDTPHPGPAITSDTLTTYVAAWRIHGRVPEPQLTDVAPSLGTPALQAPTFQPPPPPPPPPPPAMSSVDPSAWGPPMTAPVVADLAANQAGFCLLPKVADAQAAAPSRSFWRQLLFGRRAPSSWELGLSGEQMVDAELTRLASRDPRWKHLNSIPVGTNDSDIDHLLVCPAGVFTINTKHHPNASLWVGGNTIMVNGTRHPYVRNSRFEAQRASRLLSNAVGQEVSVHGLIVAVGLRRATIRQSPEDVLVMTLRRLPSVISALPPALSAQQIDEIYGYARLSSTWQPSA